MTSSVQKLEKNISSLVKSVNVWLVSTGTCCKSIDIHLYICTGNFVVLFTAVLGFLCNADNNNPNNGCEGD